MNESLADRLSRLARDAEDLANSIRNGNEPDERLRRYAHQLRQHFGVGLVLAEDLARQSGNGSMLTIDDRGDVGRMSYEIALNESEIADVEMQ